MNKNNFICEARKLSWLLLLTESVLVKVIFEAQYPWTGGLAHEFFHVLLFVESNKWALSSQ